MELGEAIDTTLSGVLLGHMEEMMRFGVWWLNERSQSKPSRSLQSMCGWRQVIGGLTITGGGRHHTANASVHREAGHTRIEQTGS